jgi:hypothetical protein
MMIDCNGINIAPTIPRKKIGVVLDRIFAIAKPAMVATTRIIEIAPAQTRVEFNNCFQTGRASKSFIQDLVERPGAPKYCSLDLNEVLIMKKNG